MSARSDVGRWGMVPLWLLQQPVSDRAIRLFAHLGAEWADRDTDTAHPTRATLASALGCSEDSVDRAIHELREVGALAVEPRFADRQQLANSYRLRYALLGRAESGPQPSLPGAAPVNTLLGTDAAQIQNHIQNQDQNHDPEEIAMPSGAERTDEILRTAGLRYQLASGVIEAIDGLLEVHGWPDTVLTAACDKAREKGAESATYVRAILAGWAKQGLPKQLADQALAPAQKFGVAVMSKSTLEARARDYRGAGR